MRHIPCPLLVSAIVFAALTSAAPAQLAALADPGFAAMEARENAANGKVGPRTVPGRAIPVPDTVSPQLRAAIAAPYRVPAWDADPKSAAEWKELIRNLADAGAQARREAREKLGVTMEPTVIGGVKAFILTPKEIPAENRNRLLIHVHGGGYVYNPGEAGTSEGTLMAAYGGFKVISIDYRMPPDFPYPAAMDDAMAVWREASVMVKMWCAPASAGAHRLALARYHTASGRSFGAAPSNPRRWAGGLRWANERIGGSRWARSQGVTR